MRWIETGKANIFQIFFPWLSTKYSYLSALWQILNTTRILPSTLRVPTHSQLRLRLRPPPPPPHHYHHTNEKWLLSTNLKLILIDFDVRVWHVSGSLGNYTDIHLTPESDVGELTPWQGRLCEAVSRDKVSSSYEYKEIYGRDSSRHIQYTVRTKCILLFKRLLQPPCPGLRDLYGFDGSKLVTERTLSGDITAFRANKRPDLIKGLR